MKKNLLYLSFLLILFNSCEKSELLDFKEKLMVNERTTLPTAIQILEMLQEPVNGYIHMTSYTTLASQNTDPEYSIALGGYCLDNQEDSQNFGVLNFNNGVAVLNADPSNNNFYGRVHNIPSSAALYGQSINVSLAGNPSLGLPGFSSDFETPKLLYLSNPTFTQGAPTNIYSGLSIQWNSDENNKFGIGIMIEYNPQASVQPAPEGTFKRTTIHTEDDGNYTISSQDLNGIPEGAYVSFHIGRANYERVAMDQPNYHIGLVAYTVIAHNFTRTN